MTAPKGLHAKLAQIRSEFGPIEKTGEMKEGPRFKYVEAREIASKFVEKTSALGITMLPTGGEVIGRYRTISEKQHVVDLKMLFTITDSESGQFIEVVGFGSGADNSDKGLPKAQTNAMKYAILLVLQAAGDDPEADPKSQPERPAPSVIAAREVVQDPPATPAMLRKVFAVFGEKGLGGEDHAELRQAFTMSAVGKSSSKDLTARDVDKLLVALAAYSGL